MKRLAIAAAAWLAMSGCQGTNEIAALTTTCGTEAPSPSAERCGAGDPNLPPEPTLPTDVCQTLVATKSGPDEDQLDTARIQAALDACRGRSVKLVHEGDNNAFVASHLTVSNVTLWVDEGVTLYASRNAELYQKTGNCGVIGVNDSGACNDFITVNGASPGIVGDGVIDGQGGEPLVGHDYSWWQMSAALRNIDGSIGNPTLINVNTGTTGLLLYRITLHNSPKFHVKLSSSPPGNDKTCTSPGKGFIVWGVTVLTPSRWKNSQGLALNPLDARNTDGIDPGANDIARCGVIACSTISTSDDQIAIKGGHYVADLVIAHNHFGTGHGMSIGSETNSGVNRINVFDLSIDGSIDTGGAPKVDLNGIRIKSDPSRGGLVNTIMYTDVCMRDLPNPIIITPHYAKVEGAEIPQFKNIMLNNVRSMSSPGKPPMASVVTLMGYDPENPSSISLNNVIIDGATEVKAAFAKVTFGPGPVSFTAAGNQVTVENKVTNAAPPNPCAGKFPKLPVP